MITYKIINGLDGNPACIHHVERNAFIPFDESNTDYQAYLAWVAEGNQPLPADEVTV